MNRFHFTLLVFLISLASLLLGMFHQEKERGHFTAFYQSIVHDGDLNIVNQVDPKDRWLVTETYNHPTLVSHGVVLFWLPFYAYVDLFLSHFKDIKICDYSLLQISALIRNAFFFLLAMMLLARKVHKPVLLIGVLTSPLLWFLFFDPFSTEVTLFFLGTLWTIDFIQNPPHLLAKRELFSRGVLLGVLAIVKISFLPALAATLGEVILFNGFRAARVLLGGWATPIAAMVVNDFIQTGHLLFFHQAQLNKSFVLASSNLLTFHFITSSNSYFSCSPVFILYVGIALFSLITFSKSKLNDKYFMSILVLMSFSMLIYRMSYALFYPDEISSRLFIPVLPACFVLLNTVWVKGSSTAKKFLLLFALICAYVNWIHTFQFATEGVVHGSWLQIRYAQKFFEELIIDFSKKWTKISTLSAILLFAPLFGLIAFVASKRIRISHAAYGLCLIYFTVTFSNALFNTRNVTKLKEGHFFENSVVSGSLDLNDYDEMTSIIESGIRYLPSPYNDEARNAYSRYLGKVVTQTLVDPIQLQANWRKGIYRPSLWNSF